MNAVLLKRLFRAVSSGLPGSIEKVTTAILEDERSKGHGILAHQLEEILKSSHPNILDATQQDATPKNLVSLPTSRRHQEPLATFHLPENLRHHMVLPPDVEQRFRRIEQEYAASDRLALFGLHPRKKILLHGPPGCGKSLGAERLAWNTGLPLIKVRFDSIMSSYFGESASNLREVFEASKERPKLLFLDECDFVARSRNANNDVGEVPRIVNTLLQLLDEYDAPGLLIAATNLGDALDKAIFRRFDDVFEVPLPGESQIRELLKVTLSAINLAHNIDWQYLVKLLKGRSAANVVKVAQDAAKTAILSLDLPVGQHHLENAIAENRQTQ